MLQMHAVNKQKGLFCVEDPKYEQNKILNIVWVDYNETFLRPLLEQASTFWKPSIFPLLIN